MGTAAPIGDVNGVELADMDRGEPAPLVQLPAAVSPQPDLFGVPQALTLEEVKRSVVTTGTKQLRLIVRRSELDPLVNMLALAMDAQRAGEKDKAFARFEAVLPYVWAKLSAPPGMDGEELPPGASAAVAMRFEWKAPE